MDYRDRTNGKAKRTNGPFRQLNARKELATGADQQVPSTIPY